jgi:hypothetical protein
MSSIKINGAALAAVLLLTGCIVPPMGPTIPVMPAPNKPFDVFREDQTLCGEYASQQISGSAQFAANSAFATGAAATVLGAGLGAAVGGGRGAAVGAAEGAVVGTALGAGSAQQSEYSLQQRYNMAYAQCMFSRGNQVPGFAPVYAPPPPPPPGALPPPPAR